MRNMGLDINIPSSTQSGMDKMTRLIKYQNSRHNQIYLLFMPN